MQKLKEVAVAILFQPAYISTIINFDFSLCSVFVSLLHSQKKFKMLNFSRISVWFNQIWYGMRIAWFIFTQNEVITIVNFYVLHTIDHVTLM